MKHFLQLNFQRCWLPSCLPSLLLSCLLLSSCSTTDSNVKVPGYLPLVGGYTISRNSYYPLSTAANIYVSGSDPALVEQLKTSLKHHFVSVAAYPLPEEHHKLAGFVLHIEPLGNGIANDSGTSGRDYAVDNKRKIKYKISVTDLHRDQPFDDVLISLESRIFLAGSKHDMLQDAFDDVAARLSGRTFARL